MVKLIGAAFLAAALAAPSLTASQGRGPGPGHGPGFRRGAGMIRGMCCGMQFGRQAGLAPGGWWTRVTPQTEEQKALVQKVSELHAQIRAANMGIASLTAQKADPARIAAKRQEATALRTQVQNLTQRSQAIILQMGVPAGRGVCDGTGPKGPMAGCATCPNPGANCAECPHYGVGCAGCAGPQSGARRTAFTTGRRLRNGSGPNPNCPLRQ